MTINFNYEDIDRPDINFEELLKKVIEACLDYEKCPYETEVNVLFTNDQLIKELNREFRNIDYSTDVLSFPMIHYEEPGNFGHDELFNDCFDPDTGELLLGDIVISIPRAELQAVEYGHSVSRELAFLTAHSMFHLMGYDHLTEDEAAIMEAKQREVLDQLGITR